MNTHIRDNENFLNSFHGCRVYKSATQTVSAGVTDVVTFNSEDYDTDTLHDTVTNNSRITIPTGLAGYWRFMFKADIDADAAANVQMHCQLRKNAAGLDTLGTQLDLWPQGGTTVNWSWFSEWTGPLVVGDYVEAFFRAVTEGRVLGSGIAGTIHQATYLGA